MPGPSARANEAPDIERFLASLAGVRSVRVVATEPGRIDEIHVLCAPSLHPKQVVRNIESALSAGRGIHIDRRIVSVAQVRGEVEAVPVPASTAAAEHRDTAPAAAAPYVAPAPRFVFLDFDAHNHASGSACRVTIRHEQFDFSGEGVGPTTPQGRARAAADAVFAAIGSAAPDARLGLDGVAIAELSGRDFVLVVAEGSRGREAVRLTGIAALLRSPEEAAILASLQAVNRWVDPCERAGGPTS